MIDLVKLLSQFSPLSDEEAKAQAKVAAVTKPTATAPAASPAPQGIVPIDVKSAVAPLYVPRSTNTQAPQIDISDLLDNKGNAAKELEFKKSLQDLKDEYKLAQEEASSREFKAKMFAAVGSNIGQIMAGQQAMNTKASVKPTALSKIDVPDLMAKVDGRFKTDYEGLLSQYKGLRDGQLGPKEIAQVRSNNAFLSQKANQQNANADGNNKSNLARGLGISLKDQEKGEMSDKQVDASADFETAIAAGDLIGLGAEKFKDFLGPASARVESYKRMLPGTQADSGFTEFSADVERMGADYRKVISGLTVSDKEKESLNNSIPIATDKYSDFMAKQRSFVKNLRRAKAISDAEIAKKQGKNVVGYAQPSAAPTSSAPNGQDMVEKNGKNYKWNASVGKYQLAQ